VIRAWVSPSGSRCKGSESLPWAHRSSAKNAVGSKSCQPRAASGFGVQPPAHDDVAPVGLPYPMCWPTHLTTPEIAETYVRDAYASGLMISEFNSGARAARRPVGRLCFGRIGITYVQDPDWPQAWRSRGRCAGCATSKRERRVRCRLHQHFRGETSAKANQPAGRSTALKSIGFREGNKGPQALLLVPSDAHGAAQPLAHTLVAKGFDGVIKASDHRSGL